MGLESINRLLTEHPKWRSQPPSWIPRGISPELSSKNPAEKYLTGGLRCIPPTTRKVTRGIETLVITIDNVIPAFGQRKQFFRSGVHRLREDFHHGCGMSGICGVHHQKLDTSTFYWKTIRTLYIPGLGIKRSDIKDGVSDKPLPIQDWNDE